MHFFCKCFIGVGVVALKSFLFIVLEIAQIFLWTIHMRDDKRQVINNTLGCLRQITHTLFLFLYAMFRTMDRTNGKPKRRKWTCFQMNTKIRIISLCTMGPIRLHSFSVVVYLRLIWNKPKNTSSAK